MYVVAIFGILMMLLSVVMIIAPKYFANGIVKFSEKKWFHPFEIISRFVFGLGFVLFAAQTRYPTLMSVIGCVLIAVSLGLLFTRSSKHKEYAVWSAEKFKNYFRWFGFVSLAFGAFLIYTTV